MFRTRTTLVVGAGAGYELELPDGRELLSKIAQGFDFQRLGTDLQTRDMVILSRHFEKLARRVGATQDRLHEAALAIRAAARVSSSIDAILEQHSHDPLVQAVGKLAIVYYTLQAEARSPLGVEPRDPGDLPLRGNENWLFQLSRMIVGGVPREQIDRCFNNLSIVNFTYDRSLQHYLPWAVALAFGMTLAEARTLVAAKVKIVHPFGSVGRLPWQTGEAPDVEWGTEEPWNIHNLINEIRTPSQVARDSQFKRQILGEIAGGKRIVFLGFGFEPQATELLFDYSLSHDPDILVSLTAMPEAPRGAIQRTLKRLAGIENGDLVSIQDLRPYQMLRDNALFLES